MEHFPWVGGSVLVAWLLLTLYKAWAGSRVSPNVDAPTFCPIPSYEVEVKDGFPTIKCLRCHMTSWHPKDVENLYCGNCHEFHIGDAELDHIYDLVDTLMKTGQFSALDKLLNRVDVESASADILLGYLTATLPAKRSLPSRSSFFYRVRLELIKLDDDPVALLRGLE